MIYDILGEIGKNTDQLVKFRPQWRYTSAGDMFFLPINMQSYDLNGCI